MIRCLCLVLLLLAGCGEELPRAPLAPLQASEEALSGMYKWGAGPWPVAVATGSIEHPQRDQALEYRLYYPQMAGRGEQFPILLFSHGNWSGNAKYDNLIEHWVSHGYIVLAPLHMDGAGGYVSGTVNLLRYGNLGLIQARVDDLVALLDALSRIEAAHEAVNALFDHELIAATGHSFGAFNAQQLGGAAAFDTDNDTYVATRDERVRAVVAVSPPGPMFDEITEGSWQQQRVPTLMTTGTRDTNAMFWPRWQLHRLSFDTAQPGDQFALVVRGADHYLGNLIGRPELQESAQHDALNMVNTAAVAFLDAYLKNIPAARDFLSSGALDHITAGFAVLESR